MVARRLLKAAFAAGASTLGLDRLLVRRAGKGHPPLVIGYHRIVDNFDAHADSTIPAMLTSREMFEQHLDWLGARFRFVSLDEIGAHVRSGRTFSDPVVAITFDDGYRDVHDQALPLLVRRGIPAAVFVATDFVEKQTTLAHDRLYLLVRLALSTDRGRQVLSSVRPDWSLSDVRSEDADNVAYVLTTGMLGRTPRAGIDALMRRLEAVLGVAQCASTAQPLTWAMLATLRDRGVTIGVHTGAHVVLTCESPQVVADELTRSRDAVARHLDIDVRHFAYPDGRFNRDVVRAVAEAGFEFAYTTCQHQDAAHPLLTIPRRLLWEKSSVGPFDGFSPSIMNSHLCGLFDRFTGCVENHLADSIAPAGRSSSDDGPHRALATF